MADDHRTELTRRSLIQGTAAAAAGLALGGLTASPVLAAKTAVPALKNADFYDAQGKFLVDKAKAAYFAMMERFGYPVVDKLKKEMWVLDFGLGKFLEVGMGGIFWLNRKEFGYFGHEIFLLPGQMIAEHAHVATPEGPAKMESWHTRHGLICTMGEGEPTKELPIKLPESELPCITCKHGELLPPGEVRDLNRLTAKHFMIAGPEGAIVSEYATFHDMAGLRFTNPKVKL
jgi:D-lyxose ketol-isomerase